MAAAADEVLLVPRLDLEGHCAPFQFQNLAFDPDGHAEQRRREVLDLDARADRVLAGVEVREQQVAAGDFDVAHQHGGGVDARLLAHEGDGAVAVYGELARHCEAGGKGGFHVTSFSETGVADLI